MDELLVAIQNAANTIATPNWADILGVFVSLAALFVAGFVAWRQNKILKRQTEIMSTQTSIADNQNKIALFEKRLEIYDLLSSCRSSALILKAVEKNEDILRYLFYVFLDDPKARRDFNRKEACLYLSNCCSKLDRATFLFSGEIVSYIVRVSASLCLLVNADAEVDGPMEFYERKQSYFEAIADLEKIIFL